MTHLTDAPPRRNESAKPSLGIIVASIREGRKGGPVGRWTHEQAVAHGGFEVKLLDLEQIGLPLMQEPNHPRLQKYTQQHTRDWSMQVSELDAFVFVTPEYNHGLSAPLKNAIDYLHHEWLYKPVGFVSYGGVAAGTRAVQMLKQVLGALRMFAIYDAVAIPFVAERFPHGADNFSDDEVLRASATAMLDELLRVQACTTQLREQLK